MNWFLKTAFRKMAMVSFLVIILLLASCNKKNNRGNEKDMAFTPSFSLSWSEYPSWSVFGVAEMYDLVDGAEGELGPIEEKWGVDLVLKEMDYDSCLIDYGSRQTDAVCITNMDILNPALAIDSIAIMPTSTSYGADAAIVSSAIKSLQDLAGKDVYGLSKTVSEYMWVRNLELSGEVEKDYKFTNMDPGAAAIAFQQNQSGFDAIAVWNPFVLETLNKRADSRVLFDSTTIPGEIVDMVVMSKESLEKPKGAEAAAAIADAYYQVTKLLADPETQNDALVALGEKFSHLDAEAMKTVVRQTRFYSTPEQGISLFNNGTVFPWAKEVDNTSDLFTNDGFNKNSTEVSSKSLNDIMPVVVDFCLEHEIISSKPSVGFNNASAQLVFDSKYMEMVK